MVPLAVIPRQALESRPQTVEKRVAVWLLVSPELATQPREETMQVQTSELAMGGRLEDAAQAVPEVGQAEATVLLTTYAAEAVLLGVAFANCAWRVENFGSLLATVPLRETTPGEKISKYSKGQ